MKRGPRRIKHLPHTTTEEDINNIIKNQDYLLTSIGYIKTNKINSKIKLKRYEKISICKYCGDEYIKRKNNKQRKYCDKCKNLLKSSTCVHSKRVKKDYEQKYKFTENFKLVYGTKGFGILFKPKSKYFDHKYGSITNIEILKYIDKIISELEETRKLFIEK